VAGLIIKKTVPFWRSFIQGFRPVLAFLLLTPETWFAKSGKLKSRNKYEVISHD